MVEEEQVFWGMASLPLWVRGGLHMYLIERTWFAYLGGKYALDDESGSDGSAA
jgi:hypothetical protein